MSRFWWGFLLLGVVLLIMSLLSWIWDRKVEGLMIGLGVAMLFYAFSQRRRET